MFPLPFPVPAFCWIRFNASRRHTLHKGQFSCRSMMVVFLGVGSVMMMAFDEEEEVVMVEDLDVLGWWNPRKHARQNGQPSCSSLTTSSPPVVGNNSVPDVVGDTMFCLVNSFRCGVVVTLLILWRTKFSTTSRLLYGDAVGDSILTERWKDGREKWEGTGWCAHQIDIVPRRKIFFHKILDFDHHFRTYFDFSALKMTISTVY